MFEFKLNDQELQRYGELFQNCDVEGTGKFSWQQVSELFRSSGLNQDVLLQITELCGAKRLGHFGRSQFYIALKLIAAVQFGLPLTQESLNSGIDIPLPTFNRVVQTGESRVPQQNADLVQGGSFDRQVGHIPPPPASARKVHSRNLSGQFQDVTVIPVQSTPVKDGVSSEAISPPFSPASPLQMPAHSQAPPIGSSQMTITPPTSPNATPLTPQYPVISTSVPPTSPSTNISQPFQSQGGHSQGPASAVQAGPQMGNGGGVSAGGYVNQGQETEWTNFDSDEKEGLIESGIRKDWDSLKLPEFDSSSISSDPESIEDVFSINDEQREYYVRQFQNLEPDINGSIQGPVAKEFFVKSKLSNQELSKIWHLSDLNKDGALNLEEFCIAMHLVVLRRNEIEIPDRLPFSLMPYNAFTNEEPFAADLPQGSTLKRQSPSTSPSVQTSQWEKVLLQESPQISSSEVSSPGVTPANFDFPKPESDDPEARILHPTPRRVSPDSQADLPDGRVERGRAFSDPLEATSLHETDSSPPPLNKRRSNTTASHAENNLTDAPPLQGRPRPAVRKATVPGTLPGHILPPVPISSQSVEAGDRPVFSTTLSMEDTSHEPPVPPPRPGQHGRSFSVDYKGPPLAAPPAVPPRTSDKDVKFAEFKKFQAIQSQEQLHLIADVDAPTLNGTDRDHPFLDYTAEGAGADTSTDYAGSHAVDPQMASELNDFLGDNIGLLSQSQYNRDKKELQMAIRTHKERNSTLTRLNSELNQELQEVMEQRIALEIQLGHLRPFSS